MERKDGLTEPKDWNPPGWTLLKDAIHSKYESSSVPHRQYKPGKSPIYLIVWSTRYSLGIL